MGSVPKDNIMSSLPYVQDNVANLWPQGSFLLHLLSYKFGFAKAGIVQKKGYKTAKK